MAKRRSPQDDEPRPKPRLNGPYQPGISDPQWPVKPQSGPDSESYQIDRAGRVDPQGFVTLVGLDVKASNRSELESVLRKLSDFAIREMTKTPVTDHLPVGTNLPATWRVTVTIALGAPLFLTEHGDDRFGLHCLKPRWLRIMPKVEGDVYDPTSAATDLMVIISSDHPYVNIAIARSIIHGFVDGRLITRRVEQGFSRPDKREFLRFDDGIDNLSNARDGELDRFVFVHEGDGEPEWCVNGAYLAWRKIRENLTVWEKLSVSEQEGMIGREKFSGNPLSLKKTGPGEMMPVYPDPRDGADGPLTAHIRKVQPRRAGLDFTGTEDLERRFLRRGYPFFDGLDNQTTLSCGLLFIAFMRNLRKQFEWPVQMWQLNPDFPKRGTGIDMLYQRKILSNHAGGFYFCPPAPQGPHDFIASSIFA